MKPTECRQIEQAHQEWIAALDVVEYPIFMHDKEFRILRCNRAYQQYTKLPFNEIIGKPYYDLLPKTGAPLHHCLEALAHPESETKEEEIESEGIIFRSRSYSIRNEGGEYLYSLHTLEDITSKRQMERALEESEEKFRSITSSAQDAIVMMDERGNISYWNCAAEKMFGYSADEAFGRRLHTFITPPRYLDAHEKGYEHFLKSGEGAVVGKTVELSALKKGGEEFPIELSLSAVKLEGGWNAIGIIRDSSERKQTQELLRQSEEKFRALVESTSDWIWEVDAAGNYTYVSPRIETLLGFTPDEVIGKSPFELMSPDEAARIANEFGAIIAQRAPILGMENINICKDGTRKVLETSGVPFYNEKNEFAGYRGVDRDITERKRSEISLNRANRALKTLSAGNMALVRVKNENELLQTITEIIVEQAGYSLAAVVYAQEDSEKSIALMAGAGMSDHNHQWAEHITWEDTPQGQLPVSLAIRSGETQVCHNIACAIGFDPWKESARSQGFASNIALPLINEKKTFGALCIYSTEENAFDASEIHLLEELANDLAYGIINLRTRVAHEQQSALLRQSLEESIQTIAATVEARDPYTAGHQRRVAELATAIAREMQLDEEQIRAIHFASIIHDLGKIHIPAEILSKPGRLNAIEFMLIQTHSQEGYNILKEVHFPWPIAETILQHHEKLDGSGYPNGLKGDQIRLEAKIITVADVMEAMSSHRPYRAALGIEPALNEINRGRGIQYEPAVVDACSHLFLEKGFQFTYD